MITAVPHRVAVLDRREVVRAGVGALLSGRADLLLVASAGEVAELARHGGRLDAVLFDPGVAGSPDALRALVRQLRALGAAPVALVEHAGSRLVQEVAAAGAAGLVPSAAPGDVLVNALRETAARRSPGAARAPLPEPEAAPDPRLSAGERQVLAIYASGATARMVASRTGLSLDTVTTYVRRIRVKYERVGRVAASRIDLFHRAVEDGLLDGEPAAEAPRAAS